MRNPNYAASTDSKAARENLPDEFDFTIDSNPDDIFNKVAAGQRAQSDMRHNHFIRRLPSVCVCAGRRH